MSTSPEISPSPSDLPPLHIGLLNLMPATSLDQTFDDFRQLIQGSGIPAVLTCYKFQDDPRESNPSSNSARIIHGYKTYKLGQTALDGLIITGANHELTDDKPPKLLPFKDIHFYAQLVDVMLDADKRLTTTYYSCLAAQIALKVFFDIDREPLGASPKKHLGVYHHGILLPEHPFIDGLGEQIIAPHSRWGNIKTSDLENEADLAVLAKNPEVGWLLAARKTRTGLDILAQGHPEYSRLALHSEHIRDRTNGNDQKPKNYYSVDSIDPESVEDTWHEPGVILMGNWLRPILQARNVANAHTT